MSNVLLIAPLQERSRRTLDAILIAVEALLVERTFDEIAITDIVERSGCSTGSFYARFPSKDALLPALYARYHADIPGRVARAREASAGSSQSLGETIDLVIDTFIANFAERPNLMRAMALFVRVRPEAVDATMHRDRQVQHDAIARHFEPFYSSFPHADPAAAVRAGLFMAGTVIREHVLFGNAPFAAATGLPIDALRRELARMLKSYLTLSGDDR